MNYTKKHATLTAVLTALIIIGIFITVTVCNLLSPLFADDYAYSVSFESKQPISSFYDIYRSQLLHYKTTNGRTVVHSLAQLLLWIGKPALDFINGAVFCVFCVLLYYHAAGTLRHMRPQLLLYIFMALWFFTPTFGGSYLWVMGAANYLYSPVIILLYMIPYRRALARRTSPDNSVYTIEKRALPIRLTLALLWFICGIIAGWTNENTSLAMIVMVIFINIICNASYSGARLWMWCGLAGNIIGASLLFFSPAQALRLAESGGFGTISDWLDRFVSISGQLFTYMWQLMLVFAALITVFLFITSKADGKKYIRLRGFAPTAVYLAGAGIAVYSMVGSPEFPRWVWSSIVALCVITVGSVYCAIATYAHNNNVCDKNIADNKKRSVVTVIRVFVIIIIIAAFIFSYRDAIGENSKVKEAYDKRVAYIESEISCGRYDVTVDYIESDSPYCSYSMFNELSRKSDGWLNTAVARYFGLHSISRRD